MPLNLSVNDGVFTPYLKYNSKAGRFYVKADGIDGEIEIEKPLLAFDMANIKTGWICYREGAGPEKLWDANSSQEAPRPMGQGKWQRGFEVMVYGNALIPGTNQKIAVREFNSNANATIVAVKQMYAEYEAAATQNPNKVPVFACTGVKPVVTKHGTNYEPVFQLQSWIDRSRTPGLDAEPLHPLKDPDRARQIVTGKPVYDDRNPPPIDRVPESADNW